MYEAPFLPPQYAGPVPSGLPFLLIKSTLNEKPGRIQPTDQAELEPGTAPADGPGCINI